MEDPISTQPAAGTQKNVGTVKENQFRIIDDGLEQAARLRQPSQEIQAHHQQ